MSGSADERTQLLQDDGEPTEEQNSEQEDEQEAEQQEEKQDEEEPVKINVWNLVDLKNACDDHLQKYMTTKAGYQQSHTNTDVKLVIGYVGCAFVLAGGGYTYIITSAKEDPQITTLCVVVYAVANVLLYLYSLLVEKDIVFVGAPSETLKEQFPNHTLTVSANTKRYSDVYDVILEFKPSGRDSEIAKYMISRPFCVWFDETGVLHGERFEEFLEEGLQAVRSGGKPHIQ